MAEVQELRDEIAALQLTLKSTVVAAAAAKKDDSGLAAAPGLRLKFAAPPKFTGLVPAGRNVASELVQWIACMTAHLRRIKLSTVPAPSEALLAEVACSFLEGEAGMLAERIINQADGAIVWRDIEAALRRRWGASTNSFVLVSNLQAVRQQDRGLRAYTASFAAELDFLESAGLNYNTLVLAMYLTGMNAELAQSTYTELSAGATDALTKFNTHDLARALQQVANVAANHEDVHQRYSSGSNGAANRAGTAGWTKAPTLALDKPQQSARVAAVTGESSVVARFAKQFGISEAMVRARFEANSCMQCGGSGHRRVVCPKNAHIQARANVADVAAPVPSNSSAQ
jgi:hypothetical protein